MIVYSRYAGIGDAVFVNTFVYQKGLETGKRVFVGTNHPSIFKGNPYARVLPFITRKGLIRFLIFCKWIGRKIEYVYLDYGNPGEKHIFDVLQAKTRVSNRPVKPFIGLSEKEIHTRILPLADNRKIVAIQSTGATGWTDNKNYYADRYARIAGELQKSNRVVQLGQASDPLPAGVEDFRGRLSFRQVFQLMGEIDLFIGQVGFLMHAAAARDCPSVIIYGGFEAPWQSGYAANHNIFTSIHCSPCWKEHCPYNKKCMDMIVPEQVIAAARERLSDMM